jgi:hypothetical protein
MRLYGPDLSLAACPGCDRLHSAWVRFGLRHGEEAVYFCSRCQARAPLAQAGATEGVVTGRLTPPVDEEAWPDPNA